MNRMLVGGMLAGALGLLAGTEGFGESIMKSLRKQGVGTTPRPLDPIGLPELLGHLVRSLPDRDAFHAAAVRAVQGPGPGDPGG